MWWANGTRASDGFILLQVVQHGMVVVPERLVQLRRFGVMVVCNRVVVLLPSLLGTLPIYVLVNPYRFSAPWLSPSVPWITVIPVVRRGQAGKEGMG